MPREALSPPSHGTPGTMYALEEEIDPIDLELPGGDMVRIVAAYPGGKPQPASPFDLAPPVPLFGPVALKAGPGNLAMFFSTRERAVSEGPRRTGLGENVLLCSGEFLEERLGALAPAFEPVDAPGWPGPSGRMSLTAQLTFPLAGRGVDASAEIMCRVPGGRGFLMSVEQRQGHRDAVAGAFAAFVSDNPGLPDMLERGLALMDAAIMRFEADRLVQVAEIEASRLQQGAEVLEEAAGFEPEGPTP
jgi:hypothetical protein